MMMLMSRLMLALAATGLAILLSTASGKTPHKRRVAVVVSGGLRSYTVCNASFFDKVVAKNPGFSFNFFVYAVAEDAEMAQLGSWPTAAASVSSAASHAAVFSDLPNLARLPAGDGTAVGKAGNIASMFRSIERGDALRSDWERHHEEHDLVIRMRPDMMFCSDLDLAEALRVLKPNDVLLPFFAGELAFDQFAIAKPAAMAKFARSYSTTLKTYVSRNATKKRPLYPEHEMWRHCHATKLNLLHLPNFKTTLVRTTTDHKTGARRFYQEDAYTKLRKDFGTNTGNKLGTYDSIPPPLTDYASCGGNLNTTPRFLHRRPKKDGDVEAL